ANPGTKLAQICPTLSGVEKCGTKRPETSNEINDDLREWCPMPMCHVAIISNAYMFVRHSKQSPNSYIFRADCLTL
ncbi:hypothetical protein, partial [Rhizobium leguminosarum]|uniref:hypothetical protein n=1 Tax=Rhizobium leguminosarum TaxID=384 RepID=UPI001A8E66FD